MEELLLSKNAGPIGITVVAVYLILKLVFEFVSKRHQLYTQNMASDKALEEIKKAIQKQTMVYQKMFDVIRKIENQINKGSKNG